MTTNLPLTSRSFLCFFASVNFRSTAYQSLHQFINILVFTVSHRNPIKPKEQGRKIPPPPFYYFRFPAEFLAAALCARAAKLPLAIWPPFARAVVLWILAAELVVIGVDFGDLETFFMLSSFGCWQRKIYWTRSRSASRALGTQTRNFADFTWDAIGRGQHFDSLAALDR
jgi:hypothetical protein